MTLGKRDSNVLSIGKMCSIYKAASALLPVVQQMQG